MTFGQYLRDLREARDWRQPDAADRLQIEQSYLSKLETGKSLPSDDVFQRLMTVYGFTLEDLEQRLSEEEVDRLRRLGEVRHYVLSRQQSRIIAIRSWLLGALGCLVLAGGCFGFYWLGSDSAERAYFYRSYGVLKTDEPLDAFEIVDRASLPRLDDEVFLKRQAAMVARLDPDTKVLEENRGAYFLETVPEGRRAYDQVGSESSVTSSPLHWFLVPSLMFFCGAIGCFLVAFRWR